MDTQNFGGYNIIPRHFLVAGHKNFNILSNADADADANADALVTAIALPVLTYRRAKNTVQLIFLLTYNQSNLPIKHFNC